eukprot:PhM_4_TR17526/c0_g1_i1/m.3796
MSNTPSCEVDDVVDTTALFDSTGTAIVLRGSTPGCGKTTLINLLLHDFAPPLTSEFTVGSLVIRDRGSVDSTQGFILLRKDNGEMYKATFQFPEGADMLQRSVVMRQLYSGIPSEWHGADLVICYPYNTETLLRGCPVIETSRVGPPAPHEITLSGEVITLSAVKSWHELWLARRHSRGSRATALTPSAPSSSSPILPSRRTCVATLPTYFPSIPSTSFSSIASLQSRIAFCHQATMMRSRPAILPMSSAALNMPSRWPLTTFVCTWSRRRTSASRCINYLNIRSKHIIKRWELFSRAARSRKVMSINHSSRSSAPPRRPKCTAIHYPVQNG